LDLIAFTYATNIVNLISDLLIFALPIPVILPLQISRNRKIGFISLFSIGLMYVLPGLTELIMLSLIMLTSGYF